jgi:mannose/fructose-specific phosphotransferase system component IIA
MELTLMNEILKPRPEPLPATFADLMTHRKKAALPNLNNQVERLYGALFEDIEFRKYLDAVHNEDAREGWLVADDLMAAKMIREYAEGAGNDPYVAGKNLATIVKALRVVLDRFDQSRKTRAARARDKSEE